MRHPPANGVVSVTVEPDTDHVLVAVEDTGAGLPPNGEQRMFDRFWRDDESRAHATGRDLGREPDVGGARVAFTLPLAEPPPSRERA